MSADEAFMGNLSCLLSALLRARNAIRPQVALLFQNEEFLSFSFFFVYRFDLMKHLLFFCFHSYFRMQMVMEKHGNDVLQTVIRIKYPHLYSFLGNHARLQVVRDFIRIKHF